MLGKSSSGPSTTGAVVVNYRKPLNDAQRVAVTSATANVSLIQLRKVIKVLLGTVHRGSYTSVMIKLPITWEKQVRVEIQESRKFMTPRGHLKSPAISERNFPEHF